MGLGSELELNYVRINFSTISEIEVEKKPFVGEFPPEISTNDNPEVFQDINLQLSSSKSNHEIKRTNSHETSIKLNTEIQDKDLKPDKDKEPIKPVRKYYGIIIALLSTICIALSTYLVKILKVKYGYHVFISIFWRFVGISVLSIPVLWYYYQKKTNMIPKNKSDIRKGFLFVVGRCIFGTSGFVFQYMALNYIPLGDSSVISYSSPVLVLLLSWCCLKEECGWFPTFIAGLTILGVILIARPSFIFTNTTQNEKDAEGEKYKGILLSLAAMICAALTTICLRLARHIHFSIISICFGISGMLIGLALSLIFLDEFKTPSEWEDVGLFLLLGIFSFLAQIGLAMALRHESPGPVSVIRSMNCVILFGLDGISGIVPHPLSICGAIIVLASVSLIAFRRWVSYQSPNSKYKNYFGFILK